MNWSTFWSQFRVAVDSNADLSEEHKLAYLRDAVQDPATKHLLFSGAEREGLYHEVVELLKERFDQIRTIHTNYCQTLTQLGPVKSTKADLHQFIDTVRHAISGLKHTEQFDIRSFLTSILHTCLSRSLQVEWEVHSNKTKGVPPIEDFLDFVMFRAAALSTQPPPIIKAPEHKQERKPKHQPRHRVAMHVTTPSGEFKYECLLCSPEKHPLYMCAKFNTFTINQCQEHLKNNRLCHNCLAIGHKTAECKSFARCKVCQAKHHTMVHKDATPQAQPAVATNALVPKSPSIPDILMMTSQVTLTGPGGKTFLARALLDSGSLSSKAAQALILPVTKTRVTFSSKTLLYNHLMLLLHCLSLPLRSSTQSWRYPQQSSQKSPATFPYKDLLV